MAMFLRQTAISIISRLGNRSIRYDYSTHDIEGSRLSLILKQAKGLQDKQSTIDPQFIMKSPTFHKQVLSCVLSPQLIGGPTVSYDASQRASFYLNQVKSVGTYSTPLGTPSIRTNIARYISESTGIEQLSIDNIILMPSASHAISLIMKCLIVSQNDSIMIPVPCDHVYKNITQIAKGHCTEYQLNGENHWKVSMNELERSYKKATKKGKHIKAILLINPGSPTGAVYDQYTLNLIIKFAHKHSLLIIADEVNSDYMYDSKKSFMSVMQAINRMSQKYLNECQAMSLYSMQNTPLGVMGVKAAYLYCHNIHSDVLEQFFKLWNMCYSSNICGQIALDLAKTPFLDNVSQKVKQQYLRQRDQLQNYLKRRVNMVERYFQGIENVKLSKIQAGTKGYIQLRLPDPMIIYAHSVGLQLDEYFCQKALNAINLKLTPGTTYGHLTVQSYFSINILNGTQEQLGTKLTQFKPFLNNILKHYTI